MGGENAFHRGSQLELAHLHEGKRKEGNQKKCLNELSRMLMAFVREGNDYRAV